MRTQTKSRLLVLFSVVLALSLSVFVGLNYSKKNVMAEGGESVQNVIVSQKTYAGFEMYEGASIRIPNEQNKSYGIRFGTKVPASALTAIQADYQNYQSITFYTLIVRQKKLLNGDIANLTPENEDAIKVRATEQPLDGYTDYKVALLDIPEKSTDEILMARSYADVVAEDGKTHRIYAVSNNNARSIKQVALSYLAQVDAGENATKIEEEFFSVSSSVSLIGASENDSAPANLEVDLTKTLQEGENAVVAYYGTQRLTGSVENGKLNLTNVAEEIGTLELGVEQKITVYTDKYNAYKGKVVNATKIIDEAEDLEVFTITAKGTADAQNFIEGYYVVTKDIDATSWAGNNHVLTTSGKAAENEGFKGTFNMAGHTISLNTSKYGLFGNVNNSTIKDGKFIFTEKIGPTQSYGLGYTIANGTWASVVYITNVDFEVNGFGLGSEDGNKSAVIGYYTPGWVNIVDCDFTVNAEITAKNKITGMLIQQFADWSVRSSGTTLFIYNSTIATNLTAPLTYTPANLAGNGDVVINYWAGNDEGKTHDVTGGSFVFSNPYSAHEKQCTGITRTITGTLENGKIETLDISATYMYSVDDGYFIEKGTGTTFTLEQLANKLEIGACTVVSEGISYTNGVLSGVKVNGGTTASTLTTDSADYWTTTAFYANTRVLKTTKFAVTSGASLYYLEFYAYDKVINEAQDLTVLDFNTSTNKHIISYAHSTGTCRWLVGFFALSNDIAYDSTLKGFVHTNATAQLDHKRGFHGVFDGNGYSVEMNVSYRGVFGNIAGALIKNTIFKLHFESINGFGLAVQGSGGADGGNAYARTYYQDLNVEVIGALPVPSDNDSAVLFRCMHASYTYLKNINVTVKVADNKVDSKATGLLVAWDNNLKTTNDYKSYYTINVYTNSNAPIITRAKSSTDFTSNTVELWAGNDGKTADTVNMSVSTINRYALPTEE